MDRDHRCRKAIVRLFFIDWSWEKYILPLVLVRDVLYHESQTKIKLKSANVPV